MEVSGADSHSQRGQRKNVGAARPNPGAARRGGRSGELREQRHKVANERNTKEPAELQL
jgi:hypothetical protein